MKRKRVSLKKKKKIVREPLPRQARERVTLTKEECIAEKKTYYHSLDLTIPGTVQGQLQDAIKEARERIKEDGQQTVISYYRNGFRVAAQVYLDGRVTLSDWAKELINDSLVMYR
jgi:hypothetical protein